jgi:ribose transport system permease protein
VAPPTPSAARRAWEWVGVQNAALLGAVALLAAVIGLQDKNFFLPANLTVIGTSVAILGIVAIGQTLVMLLGALDISVGSEAGLASVVVAMLFTATGNAGLSIVAVLAIGALCGLVNATIIVFGRVNAVIATLATFAAFRGLANLISNGRAQGYTGADPFFTFLARGSFLGIPILIWIFVVVAVAAHVVLRYTVVGRNIYAVGGNPLAARLAGIDLNKYIFAVYLVMGALAAVAGVLLTARTGSGQPVSGSQGLELTAITAAALGGCALQGGKGTIVGTVLAVILLGMLTNGLQIIGVTSFVQDIAQGTLLVAAVVLQQRRRGVRSIGLPK